MNDEHRNSGRRATIKTLGLGGMGVTALMLGSSESRASVTTTANIAFLRTLPIPTVGNQVVYLVGHTVDNVGGGFFHWSGSSTRADDNGIAIRPNAVAANAPGRWLRIIDQSDCIDPRWYGCRADGINDDSLFFQAAVNACTAWKKKLRIPQGSILLTAKIQVTDSLCIEGDSPQSSTLVFKNNANLWAQGLQVSEYANNRQIEIRHLGFRCDDIRNTSAVIDLKFTGGNGTTPQSVVIEDIEITGAQQNTGFTHGISLFNARNVKIRGCRISGNASISDWTGTSGIRIDGDAQPVEFYITDCNFYHIDAGIHVNGTGPQQGLEGIYVSQCTFVSCNYGIFATAVSAHPLIKVAGSQFNCFHANIFALNFVHLVINGNVFYAAGPRLGHNHIGIHIGSNQTESGYTSIISDNIMLGSNFSGAPKNGIVVMGSAKFSILITSNYICGYDTPIWLDQGTRDVVVTATNQVFGNQNNCILDQGTSNQIAAGLSKCGS